MLTLTILFPHSLSGSKKENLYNETSDEPLECLLVANVEHIVFLKPMLFGPIKMINYLQ